MLSVSLTPRISSLPLGGKRAREEEIVPEEGATSAVEDAESFHKKKQMVKNAPLVEVVSLLKTDPSIFLSGFQEMEAPERTAKLESLMEFLSSWKEEFWTLFCVLNHKNRTEAILWIHLFHDSITSSTHKSEWIDYCITGQENEEIVLFLASLSCSEREGAYAIHLERRSLCLNREFCAPFIEKVVQCSDIPDFVHHMLQLVAASFEHSPNNRLWMHYFQSLGSYAQIKLFCAMHPSQWRSLFAYYEENMNLLARVTEGFAEHGVSPEEIVKGIGQISSFISEGKRLAWFHALHRNDSRLGGYFLLALSKESFDVFIHELAPEVRTDFFKNCKAAHFPRNAFFMLLEKSRRIEMVFFIMALTITDSRISIGLNNQETLYGLWSSLVELLSAFEGRRSDIVELYMSQIPPLAIGIVAMDPDKRKILLENLLCLDAEQLSFLIYFVEPAVFTHYMMRNRFLLQRDHYESIIKQASSEQWREWLGFLNGELQEVYAKFVEGIDCLIDPHSKVEVMQKWLSSLQISQNRFRTSDYRIIKKVLDRGAAENFSLEEVERQFLHIFQETEKLVRYFEERISSFRARCLIEEESDDRDLLSTLYEGFWLLLREKNLSYLGIGSEEHSSLSHAGELPKVGILSNEDLNCLCISGEWQKRHDAIKTEFLIPFLKGDKESALLRNCLDITQESLRDEQIQEVVATIQSAPQSADEKRSLCLRLLSSLKQFPLLTEEELEELERLEIAGNPSCAAWECGVRALIKQSPLSCLQRYLRGNRGLAIVWDSLRELGNHSIHSLFERGVIKDPKTLFSLSEFYFLKLVVLCNSPQSQ